MNLFTSLFSSVILFHFIVIAYEQHIKLYVVSLNSTHTHTLPFCAFYLFNLLCPLESLNYARNSWNPVISHYGLLFNSKLRWYQVFICYEQCNVIAITWNNISIMPTPPFPLSSPLFIQNTKKKKKKDPATGLASGPDPSSRDCQRWAEQRDSRHHAWWPWENPRPACLSN